MSSDEKYYTRIGNARELEGKDRRIYRWLEILPGALAWLTFILIVVAAKFIPIYAAFFIFLFDLFWFLRTVYMSLHLRASYKELRKNLSVDWMKKLEELPAHSWRDIYHLVIFPVYLESEEIITSSLKAIKNVHYPHENIFVVLSAEERAGAEKYGEVERIAQNFLNDFEALLVLKHPHGSPGELAGKGANETWAAKEATEKLIKARGIPLERVIVSSFDADTVVYPQFFGCLTYRFLTCANPLRSSFQPIPLFINNVWQAPAFARIMGFSSTFWQMMQQSRPERLITFSSHSVALAPLAEAGFWQTNVVSEDSRIFYQLFLYFDGDWEVVPMLYPVSMDANFAGTFWGTVRNQYKQQRRWGYGCENIPYLFFGFHKNKKISRAKKWHHGFGILEGFHSWATNAIMIFGLGWLPLVLGGKKFTTTLLSYSLPQMSSLIMTLAMVGMVTSAVLAIFLLPPRPPQLGRHKVFFMVLQWFLMPLNMIFLSAIPAIEAQTRLMLGKYMGFWTTPKARK